MEQNPNGESGSLPPAQYRPTEAEVFVRKGRMHTKDLVGFRCDSALIFLTMVPRDH